MANEILFKIDEILRNSKNRKRDEESIVKYLKETKDDSLFLLKSEVEGSDDLSLFKIAIKYDLEDVLCEAVNLCPQIFMDHEKMNIVLQKQYFKLLNKFLERPEYLTVESGIMGWNYLFYLANEISSENQEEIKYIIKKAFDKHPEQKNKKDKSGDTILDVMEYAGVSANLETSVKPRSQMDKILHKRKSILVLKKIYETKKQEQDKKKSFEKQ